MDLPAAIAAESAITRQNVALSVVKSSADQAQAVADILQQSIVSAPVSSTRGANVDTHA